MDPIRFIAEVYKVQTLVDGGIRVTLNISEGDIMQAAELMVMHRDQVPLEIECIRYNPEGGRFKSAETRNG